MPDSGTRTPYTARGRMLSAGSGPASTWNVANLITIGRILLAPVFVELLVLDHHAGGALRWAATALFVVAIATDSVDGRLARSRSLVTTLGILLDPIADKVLTGAALIALSALGELPVWVTVLILIRELGITGFRFAVLRDRVAISAALAPFARLLGTWVDGVDAVLMAAALLLTVVTGIDYLVQAYRLGRR